MILNNYWAIKGYTINHAPAGGSSYATIDIGLKDINGNSAGFPHQVNGSNLSSIVPNWVPFYNLNAKIGTGTTDPEPTDYAIETDCTSSFTNYTVTVNANTGSGKLETTITISGINSSGNTIDISEILVHRDLYNPTLSQQPKIALLHIKLNEPISVPAGEGFTRVITWEEA